MSAGLCPRAKQVLQLVVAEGRITRSAINRTLPDFIASAYARDLAAATRRIRQYREMQRARRIGPVMTTAPMLDSIVTSLASMGANQNEIDLS